MSNATICIRGHFDGKFIVPDEPVTLPLDAPLEIEVRRSDRESRDVSRVVASAVDSKSAAQRLAAFAEFSARLEKRAPASSIPAEALRRENMYGDEGR
jgi:hypothetical protein